MSNLDRILPFLRPIEDLLRDPTVTEVMVNCGGRRVFVERSGAIELVADRTLEVRNLTVAIKNIARACGDEISEAQPALDARLEDGSRVAAMFPPCSVDGPTLTVRKFTHRYALEELVTVGTLTQVIADKLVAGVRCRKNILISGGTGTGKTTLLNALAATIPAEDRIVLIEETSEILIDKPNLVRFEARRFQAALGQEAPLPAVTIADLLRATLRHRPDRILVGEVRGPEAFDLLQALNTGHQGALSTIHANSAEQALARLAHCVLTANVGLPQVMPQAEEISSRLDGPGRGLGRHGAQLRLPCNQEPLGGLRLRSAANEAAKPLNQPVRIRRGMQGSQNSRQRRALLNPVAQISAQPCIRGSEILRRNVERRRDSLLELGAGRTAASLEVSDVGRGDAYLFAQQAKRPPAVLPLLTDQFSEVRHDPIPLQRMLNMSRRKFRRMRRLMDLFSA